MKITKRNGTITVYDDEKVMKSILKANADAEEEKISEKEAEAMAFDVFNKLIDENEIITTKEIRECVYALLCEKGYPETARSYAEFKKI